MRRSVVAWLACAWLGWSGTAHAEISSWSSLGVGVARLEEPKRDNVLRLQTPIDVGVGLQPSLPVMVGWGAKITPYWGDGVDLGTYVRAATQNYVLGGFGVALDAGAYVRTFASKTGGFLGALNVGLPWGVVGTFIYARGPDGVQTIGGTVGLDFLRLTVYRLAGEQEWKNERPAWRP